MMTPLIIIAGPTASGKTSLAIEIAKRINGEIISADSMQIYKKMNIGTAKPNAEEMKGVRHHLLDVAEPSQSYSLKDYTSAAEKAVEEIRGRGKLPILAGGTGLYIDNVVYNIQLADTPSDPALRESLTNEAREHGGEMLERLRAVDPEAASKLHENDVRRIVRALEIYELTGITKTAWDIKSRQNGKKYDFLYFAIATEREILYNRIDTRVDAMVDAGLFEESAALADKLGATAAQGIGYRETAYYRRGLLTREETIALIKRNTRRLAKRQITWFGRNPDIIWIDARDTEKCVNMILERWSVNGADGN